MEIQAFFRGTCHRKEVQSKALFMQKGCIFMTKIQFSCDRQVFYAAITHVAKGVAQKSAIPELERLEAAAGS